MLDITAQVEAILVQEHFQEGLCVVYSPHTTAMHVEGNSAAHLKASTVGASQTVIIHNGKLLLGRWQGIYFCEFDLSTYAFLFCENPERVG